jgi:hypothetical protein
MLIRKLVKSEMSILEGKPFLNNVVSTVNIVITLNKRSGFDTRWMQALFFPTASRPSLDHIQLPTQWIRQLEREADDSLASSADGKNA